MIEARKYERSDVPALLRECFFETAFHILPDQRGKVHGNPQEGRTNKDARIDGKKASCLYAEIL